MIVHWLILTNRSFSPVPPVSLLMITFLHRWNVDARLPGIAREVSLSAFSPIVDLIFIASFGYTNSLSRI